MVAEQVLSHDLAVLAAHRLLLGSSLGLYERINEIKVSYAPRSRITTEVRNIRPDAAPNFCPLWTSNTCFILDVRVMIAASDIIAFLTFT